jgi:hypothetical protein
MKDLGTRLEHGLAVFDDEAVRFEPLVQFDARVRLHPMGQATRVTVGGTERFYFANPYPLVRVAARWDGVRDPRQYEAWTCLKAGSDLEADPPALDRDGEGRPVYGWKRDTAVVGPQEQERLVARGRLRPEQGWLKTCDAATGKPVTLHRGSVHWNAYRKRWILIANQSGGASFLGEVFYAEADEPHGPWPTARKIVTHDRYSFYNPTHHPFFDQQGGRIIYFEGTYAQTFSGNPVATPRYDYNQVMYRLDLADPRLR